jgi:acetylornithine deacetylase/succinyl-diaminopimelate desuccinylase-like protein
MPIYLVGTCGEEIGMFGAKYLIKSGALNPKYVVVGEPSDLKVVYAHKCLNLYRVTVGYQQVERDARGFNRRIDFHAFGKSAHSSYPHLGTNAIYSAMDFLKRSNEAGFEMRFTHVDGGDTVNKVPDRSTIQFYLTSHQFEDFKRFFREVVKNENQERAFKVELGGVGDTGVRFLPDLLFPCLQDVVNFFRTIASDFERVKDDSYDPSYSTVNFGKLRQIPGQINMNFDLRLLPDLVVEDIEKHIQDGIKAIASKYPALNVTAVKERMNPGLNMTLEHDLVKICQEAMTHAQIEPLLAKKATSTEAAQYFQAGYESVVFGPGKSQGNSHSPNEHNLLEHLEKAVAFYERLIERACL